MRFKQQRQNELYNVFVLKFRDKHVFLLLSAKQPKFPSTTVPVKHYFFPGIPLAATGRDPPEADILILHFVSRE